MAVYSMHLWGVLGLLLVVGFCWAQPSQPMKNVLDYGAKGDGVTKDTQAINSAIKACQQTKSQCTVYFPPGYKFLTAPFNMTSFLTLYVSKNTSLLASTDINDWIIVKPLPSYCQGRELPGPRYGPFIGGENLTNISIVGEANSIVKETQASLIDGQGQWWWTAHENGSLNYTRPRLVEFLNSRNIYMYNLHLKDSPFWTVHPYSCDQVHITHVKITAPNDSPNTDGVDPDSSTNVLVDYCEISTGDDNISVKSGMDFCGRQYGQPSANITVRYCHFPWGDGLTVGSETSGGIRNVTFEHNTVGFILNAVRIKSGPGRGGVMSGLYWRNVTGQGVANALLSVNMNWTGTPATNASATPLLLGMFVEDVSGMAGEAGKIFCLPASSSDPPTPPCQIFMENVHAKAPKGFQCEGVVAGNGTNVTPPMCFNASPLLYREELAGLSKSPLIWP